MTGADFGGVDIDLLADYIGGVLTGTPEESAVAARIADDPAWRVAYEALGEGMSVVSAELGRLGPEPMPADVADRLDAALTSTILAQIGTDIEPADTALTDTALTDTDTAHAGPANTVTAHAGPADTVSADTVSAETGPAGQEPAAAPRHLTLVGGGSAPRDGAQRVRETQPAPRPGRRLRWAAPIAVAAGLVALVGFGADYLAGRERSTDSAAGGTAAEGKAQQLTTPGGPAATLSSGTDYSHATLGIPPAQPMTAPFSPAGQPRSYKAPEMAAGVDEALRRLTAPSALAACLAAIQQANAAGALSVESVDYARFAGAPAVIVRFQASNGHWAWASGADCGTPPGDAATLDKVPVG